ncbi:MAG: DsbA family protein [Pseudomonadota bacterium]
MLTVYVDFKSPASYLALQPTLALIARYGVETTWRPFQTVERDVPAVKAVEEVGERHRRVRAQSERQTHERYAEVQGIELQFRSPPTPTDLALGALAMLKEAQGPFMQRAFEAYWSTDADLNDLDCVHALLTAVDAATDQVSEHALRNALQVSQLKAEDKGVVDAPAYVIADQIFIGRQHLPWIEEILQQTPVD